MSSATLFNSSPLLPDTPAGYARVAVERAIDQFPDGLTYAVPPRLSDLREGDRVIVPLGRTDKAAAGYVIELAASPELDPARIKPVRSRDVAGSHLPSQLIALARWISAYYCCPIGMTLGSMLPAAVKRNVGSVRKRMIDLAAVAASAPATEVKLPPKQREVVAAVAALAAESRPIEIRELADLVQLKTLGPINALVNRGVLRATLKTSVEAAWAKYAADARIPEALTAAQTTVVNDIGATLSAGFSTHLLHGVTGAGKTEIYIRLIQRALDAGRRALMLVPEISLTPQTGGRLLGRFPDRTVVILHSGLTAAQRHQQWALASSGEADIILGARSAVFAPIPDDSLGIIIVDEEHDGSYKQDQAPRYHGRDVAIRRAQLAGCPVVLGSATPSLESWHNATVRRASTLHRLPERAPGLRVPSVQIVDFVAERKLQKDRRVHLLGPTLEAAANRTLDSQGQVLLLLNRRGFASYIACPDQMCGWVMTCDQCDANMIYHLAKARDPSKGGYVRCHHCLAEQKLPPNCPQCGNQISTFGLGTQRVEEELIRKFPQLEGGSRLLRLDSDSMNSGRDLHQALERFGSGEILMLIGTQMIAKGLDYPNVRLVGVINADTALHLPDFRSTERTFQLVSQVAGRAGRGSEAGRVIVQTFQPNAPSIVRAAAHDYDGFAAVEMEQRLRSKLPPFSRMVRFVVRDEDHLKAVAAAKALAEHIGKCIPAGARLRGPAPCPIARISGYHRHQIELLAENPSIIQTLLAAGRSEGWLKPGNNLAVDVDPLVLL